MKFDFILQKDSENILRTKVFSFEEIVHLDTYKSLYKQDFYFIKKEKILEQFIKDIEKYNVVAYRSSSGLITSLGEELFDGDICFQTLNGIESTFVVIFKNGCFMAKVKHIEFPLSVAIQNDLVHGMKIELIGNIYENSSLINGEK